MKNSYLNELVEECIETELSLMNDSCQSINKLEKELTSFKYEFSQSFLESTKSLNQMKSKLNKCLVKVRPYREQLREISNLKNQVKTVTQDYVSITKNLDQIAQDRLEIENLVKLNPNEDIYIEKFIIINDKFNSLSLEKQSLGKLHKELSSKIANLNGSIQNFESTNKRCINRTKPFFETLEIFQKNMKYLKERIENCQGKVESCKANYAEALSNLEKISSDIHDQAPVKSTESSHIVTNLKKESSLEGDRVNPSLPKGS